MPGSSAGDFNKADLSVASIAYLAGIIDGEGSIQINKSRNTSGSYTYFLKINITSTSIEWLFNLREQWGGIGSFHVESPEKRAKKSPKWKPRALWDLHQKNARAVLEVILPYLRIKREQALLALNFRTNSRGRYMVPELREHQEQSMVRMKKLNFRGVALEDQIHPTIH